MNLEYFAVGEIRNHSRKTQRWTCVTETQELTERASNGQSWNALSKKIISVCNSNYKINNHESTLIKTNG